MVLVEQGSVRLENPINDYLEQKVVARIGNDKDATVLRVASHTSGLPLHAQFFYYDTPYRRLTRPSPSASMDN